MRDKFYMHAKKATESGTAGQKYQVLAWEVLLTGQAAIKVLPRTNVSRTNILLPNSFKYILEIQMCFRFSMISTIWLKI